MRATEPANVCRDYPWLRVVESSESLLEAAPFPSCAVSLSSCARPGDFFSRHPHFQTGNGSSTNTTQRCVSHGLVARVRDPVDTLLMNSPEYRRRFS